jgi:lipopolysaccharide biosynthesis glycosyltransferase
MKLNNNKIIDPKIVIAIAADGGYAMPLSTTLRSLVEANPKHWPLEVYILCDGFSPELRKKVRASLPCDGPGGEDSAILRWIPIEMSRFAGFSPGEEASVSKMSYARLLVSRVIPKEVRRVLYLDADLLILEDLAPLWQTDLGGAPFAAVPDLFLQATYEAKGLHPATERANHFRYRGLPPVEAYLNAGVLLIDLPRWREEEISEKALDYLTRHPRSPHMDQDALNAASDKRWKKLEGKWNVQDHYQKITPGSGPGIVHFVTKAKPWLAASRSPNAGLYDSFRKRTGFARTSFDKLSDSFLRVKAGVEKVLRRGRARKGSILAESR